MKTFKKKTEINLGDGEAGFISCPIPFTLQTLSAPTRQCLFIGARCCPRAGTVTNNSPGPPGTLCQWCVPCTSPRGGSLVKRECLAVVFSILLFVVFVLQNLIQNAATVLVGQVEKKCVMSFSHVRFPLQKIYHGLFDLVKRKEKVNPSQVAP